MRGDGGVAYKETRDVLWSVVQNLGLAKKMEAEGIVTEADETEYRLVCVSAQESSGVAPWFFRLLMSPAFIPSSPPLSPEQV
jgi:hypothetical protein